MGDRMNPTINRGNDRKIYNIAMRSRLRTPANYETGRAQVEVNKAPNSDRGMNRENNALKQEDYMHRMSRQVCRRRHYWHDLGSHNHPQKPFAPMPDLHPESRAPNAAPVFQHNHS
jgi:hypothetical protein